MSGTPNRRPSLAAVSPAVSGRRLSSGGITPNVATPSLDSGSTEARRGSLRDLPNERDNFTAALRSYERDLKSGKVGQCKYPTVRNRLFNTHVSELPRTIPDGVAVKTIDGTQDPVHAFDELITNNLEAVPVTLSQNHTHNLDGTITVFSTHPIFPKLLEAYKSNNTENKDNSTEANASATTSPQQQQPPSPKPALSLSSTLPSSSSHGNKVRDQVLIFNPSTNTTTLSVQAPPPHVTTPGAPSPRPSTSNSSSNKDNAPELQQHLTCPPECQYRQAVGWLDIRDLASCIVYVYQQPINEDWLEFRENGTAAEPFQIVTRGLDGITDLPTLTSAPSFGSLSTDSGGNSANTTPTSNPLNGALVEEFGLNPTAEETANINVGIIYEDDEAKTQGAILKKEQEKLKNGLGRFQGFSHRLSLAPMAEEEEGNDNFDMAALNTVVNQLAATTEDTSNSGSPSQTNRSLQSGYESGAASPSASRSLNNSNNHRSRSQSRHRRRMVTAEELSSDLTSGSSQAWFNTLKQGLGKFSQMGNISTAYLSRRHPVRTVKPNQSLYDICKVLSASGAHRVVITDATTGKINDIVSHRTIIKYFWENRETLFAIDSKSGDDETVLEQNEDQDEEANEETERQKKSLLYKFIDDLNIGTPGLTQVRNDILGLDALQEMDEHNRTGLAVVDDQGRLVGATSARTIKRITKNRDHATMSKELMNFIENEDAAEGDEESLNPEDTHEKCMVSHGAVVLLDEDITFEDVLEAMYKHNTNRIFLVDEQSYPTKVISLTDIIQLLLY